MLTGRRQFLPVAVVSFGGIGFLPRGPATAGALAGAGTFLILRPRLKLRVALLVSAVCIGQGLTGRFVTAEDVDPQFIVIDEIAGVWLALIATRSTPLRCLIGVVLFRVLDKLKPGPIGVVDRGGRQWSVMGDDLIAGLAAAPVVWAGARTRE